MASWTKHPILSIPSRESLQLLLERDGPAAVKELYEKREEAIRLSNEDPLNFGFELESWKNARESLLVVDSLILSGGNRSSKTEFCAKLCVESALANPNSEIVCFAQDASASVRIQQRAIYRYLPPELKQKTKSNVAYLNYTQQNGFTGQQFILPNGSTFYFHAYSQFTSNRSKFEGYELGSRNPTSINIGLWLDEYLDDGDLIKTMVFRLATRNAKMILSSTPVKGYTPFIGSYLKNAETIKTRPAELLNGEEVPVVQRNHEQNLDIVYFHSDQNPFGGYDRIAKELRGKPRDFILTRAYGIPVKSMTTLFPLFNTAVHVVKDRIDVSNKKEWTVYQVVDPAGARNYVAIWAAVNAKGFVHIFKEWPDLGSYGPWAEFGDPKWKHGPASDKIGYTVQGYVDLFTEIEHELKVEPYERIGDSRFFARENENNSDLFEEFANKGMYFLPSDGREIDVGINALDEWFWYNANEPVDGSNKPLLSIHESCGNLIHGLINWGHNGKKDEALKDFVDAIRYLRLHNGGDGPDHVTNRSMETTRTTKGGY